MSNDAMSLRWPFDTMAENETVLIPYGEMGKVAVAKRLTSAKHTAGKRGIVLDVQSKEHGFLVTVVAREKPPVRPVAKKVAPKSHKRQPGSTESVRRLFWRQGFLEAMKKTDLSDLPACAIIATAALKLYDEWCVENFGEKHDEGNEH